MRLELIHAEAMLNDHATGCFPEGGGKQQAALTSEMEAAAAATLDKLLALWPIVERAEELRGLLAGYMLAAGIKEIETPGVGRARLDALAQARITWVGPQTVGLILDITRLSGEGTTRVRWP